MQERVEALANAKQAIEQEFNNVFEIEVAGPIAYEAMLADAFENRLNTSHMTRALDCEPDRVFFERAENGEAVWKFRTDSDSWNKLRGKEGYAIVSDAGRVEGMIVTVRN